MKTIRGEFMGYDVRAEVARHIQPLGDLSDIGAHIARFSFAGVSASFDLQALGQNGARLGESCATLAASLGRELSPPAQADMSFTLSLESDQGDQRLSLAVG